MPTQRHSSFSTAAKNTTHDHAYASATSAPRSAQQQSANLPQQLQAIVPSCAQTCLQTYITQEYTSCPSEGLSCLCSQYSSEGYTLGELAFICLQEQCSPASQAEQASVYDICSAQSVAVSATHSTLTVPATATTSSGITTTTLDVYPTSSSSSTQTNPYTQSTFQTSAMSSSPVTAAATSSAAPVGSSTTSSTSSTSSSAGSHGTAAADSSHLSTNLTSAQAVGVSVAAFGGMAAIIAIIYLVSCIRRRRGTKAQRGSKRDSYDFIDEEPPRFSPFNYGHADPRGPLGGFAHPRIELPSEKGRKSEWYREQFPDERPNEKVSERTPAVGRSGSPESQHSIASMRTLSQLLPDKPGSTPPRPPPPPRPMRSPPATSMASPATLFEEDKSPRMVSSELPPLPQHPKPAHLSLPGRAVKIPQYASQYTLSPDEVRAPALSLQIPRQASRSARIPSPTAFPPPPIPADDLTLDPQRASRSSKAKSGASTTAGSLLNYYASPEAGSVPDFWEPEPTPISIEPQRRLKAPPTAITVTKPTYPPRAVRESQASDTSFESTDPDEPTPPDEEDRQLSPVAEHSPIAAIRYPKVPRSSNQSVPRSPPVRLSPGFAKAYGREPPENQKHDDRAALPSRKRRPSSSRDAALPHDPATPERQNPITSTLVGGGSTLAAKRRRGESAGKDGGEKRLVIDTSHSRANSRTNTLRYPPRNSVDSSSVPANPNRSSSKKYDSPLKGYGRVTSSGSNNNNNNNNVGTAANVAARYSKGLPTTTTPEMTSPGPKVLRSPLRSPLGHQEVVLRSPLWEPKLTPSRRGDDLFLQVSLGSPASAVDGGRRRAF